MVCWFFSFWHPFHFVKLVTFEVPGNFPDNTWDEWPEIWHHDHAKLDTVRRKTCKIIIGYRGMLWLTQKNSNGEITILWLITTIISTIEYQKLYWMPTRQWTPTNKVHWNVNQHIKGLFVNSILKTMVLLFPPQCVYYIMRLQASSEAWSVTCEYAI